MNFNTKTYYDSKDLEWLRASGIPVRVFDSYDGGGPNGLIIEFETLDGLKTFLQERGHGRKCWIEHEDDQVEYIEL